MTHRFLMHFLKIKDVTHKNFFWVMSCSSTSFTIDVVGAYHGSFVLESLLIAKLSKPFIHDRHWFMGSIVSDLCLLQFPKLKEMDTRMVDFGASLNSAEVFGIPTISDLRNGQSFKEGIKFSLLEKENEALKVINNFLCNNGRLLGDYPEFLAPFDNGPFDFANTLILEELNVDRQFLYLQVSELISKLTTEQYYIFHHGIDSLSSQDAKFFFVYGFGGIGKTYLWNCLSTYLKSQGEIVLSVGSSGITSTLLPNGCTTHLDLLL
ncbi:uncharacterized protein LOC129290756 [Prosopis cineraria]|uniref:uncharacterized protein LOC129290756 n=1 Tax=Prosopis cineraria TaxID=364024 RepID=UPI00240EECB5|nr:uncharacterized protein LOC129290756 [Prosopis cineraria]XP_054783685.1 uncharacterized protein LOC129290756 [Prosopis cineraria]